MKKTILSIAILGLALVMTAAAVSACGGLNYYGYGAYSPCSGYYPSLYSGYGLGGYGLGGYGLAGYGGISHYGGYGLGGYNGIGHYGGYGLGGYNGIGHYGGYGYGMHNGFGGHIGHF